MQEQIERNTIIIACCEEHALTFDSAKHARFKVNDVWKLFTDQIFRFLILGDARDNGALTKLPEIDRALQEFVGLWYLLCGKHGAYANVDLREIIV